ncbi:hypothetical protein [Nocardioides hwasunensis]|uniref:Peptidoglycan-binding protein n=1 Tax=Nocardioides hwasunensis TaxID=397258 RepID=A0ABR8MFP5_9ACTN|nr:hypothetical protein [Nocardioides hwasunensis]MBD3914906.1 hypothetical protein [Nocardioides hwasunensis]
MRTALTLLSLAALLGATSACSMGGDDVSAKSREQDVVDTVADAVPLAQDALGASKVLVDGKWSSCPGGVGHRFAGGGTLSAGEGDAAAQLEAVRDALVGAGFEDGTQVDGHVSVTRDEVALDFQQQLAATTPGTWKVSFQGPCKRYSGDDEDYVKAQGLEPARTLLD